MKPESTQPEIAQQKRYRIPSMAVVRSRLEKLNNNEMRSLARRSGVAYGTLINIRYGKTPNPGIDTVRQFFFKVPLDEQENNT